MGDRRSLVNGGRTAQPSPPLTHFPTGNVCFNCLACAGMCIEGLSLLLNTGEHRNQPQ